MGSYRVYQADCNFVWLCWSYRVYQADCNMMWLCWSYMVYQTDCNAVWLWWGPTGCIRLTVTLCDCVGPTGCIRLTVIWCDCVGHTWCIRLTVTRCDCLSYRVYQAGTFSYPSRSADSNTCWTSTVQHEVHQPLDHNWPLTSRTSNWSGRYTRLVCVHQYDFVGRLKLMNCPFKSDFIFAFSHSFLQQMNVCAKQHSDQECLDTLSLLLHQNDNTQHFTALNTLKNLSNCYYHFQQTIAQCWPTQLVLQLTIGHLFQLVVLRGDDGFGFTVAGGRPAHIYTVEPGEWSV